MTLPSARPGPRAAPRVEYGIGAVRSIPAIVDELSARRVLLVRGRRSFEASGAAAMLPALEATAELTTFADFRPNTDSADVAVGLELIGEVEPDVVVGVGGGSAMDMAKLLVAYQGVEPSRLVELIQGGTPPADRRSRLVLAPTTSGSGAEATHFAVVYVDEDKHSVASEVMRPDAVVLDPDLARSGSPYQRAASGVDAVAQAIESLWAAAANDRSRRLADRALGLLVPAIRTFVADPAEREARAMAIGSHLAGRAIDVSRTTAAHALSYGLTTGFGVSHGHAVGLTLGAFIEAHGTVPAERLQPGIDPRQHAAVMERIARHLGAAGPVEARAGFLALLDDLGLGRNLSAVGAGGVAARERLVRQVNVERLGNNPVRFSQDELLDLLASVA